MYLETAYRLGAEHAARDFETHLKEAMVAATSIPPGAPGPSSPSRPPAPAVKNPAEKVDVPRGSTVSSFNPRGSGAAPAIPGSNLSSAYSNTAGIPQGAPG